LKLCINDKREKSMPAIGGVLTTLNYVFPWLRALIQPALERRGRRVKRELKAKLAAESRDSRS